MQPQRLDKLLAGQGMLSRKQVKDIIRKGQVSVDGQIIKAADFKVLPGQQIKVDGKQLSVMENVYIMLNKPKGVVSASRDTKQKTVIDLVPPHLMRKGLFPAGRLDKDTTGFVLITDDGDFAHRILSPKSHVPKIYIATLDRPPTMEMADFFAAGAVLPSGEKCLPAKMKILGGNMAEVTICEGMYHQIKRMFAACSAAVEELHRRQIGGLELDEGLQPGQSRLLTKEEKISLSSLTKL